MGGNKEELVDHGLYCSLPRKLLSCSLFVLFTLSLIYFIFYSSPSSFSSYADLFDQFKTQRATKNTSSLPPPQAWLQCDYSDGRWVWDDSVTGPRYDSENCDMKSTEKCVVNGKPDKGYLHWRWKPAGCNLTALDPAAFLRLVRGKRLAFVGDSTARNQAEALVCHLSTAARPATAHRYEERLGRKFWRWVFPAPHSVSVSTYWSPLLVRAEGHSEDYAMTQEAVILDALTEPWAADADAMDVVVVSAGHWFPRPAMYYEDGEVVGVYYCTPARTSTRPTSATSACTARCSGGRWSTSTPTRPATSSWRWPPSRRGTSTRSAAGTTATRARARGRTSPGRRRWRPRTPR
ncbi:hypothetical protein PVAP13_4NG105319 [Panicum virgatum]|nr:hypothetical protein PVAP13_4NG105319 [Panicum virgatum]